MNFDFLGHELSQGRESLFTCCPHGGKRASFWGCCLAPPGGAVSQASRARARAGPYGRHLGTNWPRGLAIVSPVFIGFPFHRRLAGTSPTRRPATPGLLLPSKRRRLRQPSPHPPR